MPETISLQDSIIESAGNLFREQGYAATTIKQIASAAGCTTAALYYYFEDGKEHILREVIRRSAREAELTISLPPAESLQDFLLSLGGVLSQRLPEMSERFNWIMLQFGSLPDEEKRILQDQAIRFQRTLREQISRYVADEISADRMAWFVYSSFFGYQQVFAKLEMGRRVDFNLAEFGRFLAQAVGSGR
jgi:AcrR family transcriptional regulator